MKRWIAVGVTLLACLLVVGCGVPQEDYDAVVAEKEAAEAKIPSLESELAAIGSDLALAQSELATVKSDLERVQSELDSAKSEGSAAQSLVSSLQREESSLESEISSLQSEIEAAEVRIAELEAAIVAAEEAAIAAAIAAAEEAAARAAAPKLRLLWSAYGINGNTITIWGGVENISGESLHDVEVVAFVWSPDTHGEKTGSALIDENPLLPGETSRFEVRVTYVGVSGRTYYTIYFRFLDGDEIPHVAE